MKKIKIYTKAGDGGKTFLIGGKRISKDDLKLKAIGSLDEFNAVLGLAHSFVNDIKIKKILLILQNELFSIGAELANPNKLGGKSGKVLFLPEEKVGHLEKLIDYYDSKLKSLSNFILPGGSKAAASLHLARTAARGAEREIITLSKKEKVNSNILIYLNRISDLLFILARYINKQAKKKEALWKKD